MNASEPVTTTYRNREKQTHTPVKSNNDGQFYLMFFVVLLLLVYWGK